MSPASAQQMVLLGLARQLRPVQHVDAAVQAVRATPHIDIGISRRQVPLVQVRPVRQSVPRQQASPSLPQVIISHAPPVHAASQRVPQVPQLPGSVDVSTQVPEQQERPLPVQLIPAQQGWPVAPQAAASVVQEPLMQTRPASQRPSQHGSRGPPHSGAIAQVPPVQTRPEAHIVPSQHGWRSAPQTAVGLQTPRSQTSPAVHAPPSQHGSRSSPHSAETMQRPIWQTRSPSQAPPVQQGIDSPPQATRAVHVPAEQVRPRSQSDPRQHGSRSAPHSPGVVPESMNVIGPVSRRVPPSRSVEGSLSPLAQPEARRTQIAKMRTARSYHPSSSARTISRSPGLGRIGVWRSCWTGLRKMP